MNNNTADNYLHYEIFFGGSLGSSYVLEVCHEKNQLPNKKKDDEEKKCIYLHEQILVCVHTYTCSCSCVCSDRTANLYLRNNKKIIV